MVGSKDALKTHVLEAELEMPDNQTITGHNQTRAWVTRHYFYVIKFDHPYTVKEELPVEKGEKAKRLILEFDTKPGEAVQVKVAMSSVSVDGALASLQKKIRHGISMLSISPHAASGRHSFPAHKLQVRRMKRQVSTPPCIT